MLDEPHGLVSKVLVRLMEEIVGQGANSLSWNVHRWQTHTHTHTHTATLVKEHLQTHVMQCLNWL